MGKLIDYKDVLDRLQTKIANREEITEQEIKMNNKLVEWAYYDEGIEI